MERAWWVMRSSGRSSSIASCLDYSHFKMKTRIRILLLTLPLLAGNAPAARLKDLVSIEGVRENQLIGYGLVVGLAGTGDRRQTYFSAQSLTNILERMGLTVPATAIQVKNTAATMITA